MLRKAQHDWRVDARVVAGVVLALTLFANAASAQRHHRHQRPDGTPLYGPWYQETDFDRVIVEPWNTASAALFILLPVVWLWRLRGQYRRHRFIVWCLPILAVGGVGGTIYHAFRGRAIWLLLDFMPIVILALAASVYAWSKLLRRWWLGLLSVPAVVLVRLFLFAWLRASGLPFSTGINAGYSFLALVLLLPFALLMWKRRFRDAWVLGAAVAAFAAAVTCRALDNGANGLNHVLPMGSHFLWHLFGVVAAFFAIEYLYRLDRTTGNGIDVGNHEDTPTTGG